MEYETQRQEISANPMKMRGDKLHTVVERGLLRCESPAP
jgi:hypothetical protein